MFLFTLYCEKPVDILEEVLSLGISEARRVVLDIIVPSPPNDSS